MLRIELEAFNFARKRIVFRWLAVGTLDVGVVNEGLNHWAFIFVVTFFFVWDIQFFIFFFFFNVVFPTRLWDIVDMTNITLILKLLSQINFLFQLTLVSLEINGVLKTSLGRVLCDGSWSHVLSFFGKLLQFALEI